MKKILLQAAFLLFTAITALAQAPQLLNYQGIARNTSGTPIASALIGLRILIHDGSSGGTVVYTEAQTPSTNAFGLYTVSIGNASGFSSIDWAGGPKYMEVDIDATGGTTYSTAGNTQLLSVPYSIYANTASSAATAGSLTGSVAMGGDVTGTNTAATVAKLQGNNVAAATPASGEVLTWNSGTTSWTPTLPVVSLTSTGTSDYLAKFTSPTALGNALVYDNGTSVGIGTTSPTAANLLQVLNTSSVSSANAIHGTLIAAPLIGVLTPAAMYGESTAGIGVVGISSAQNAIYGYCSSSGHAGLSAYNSAAGGYGIWSTISATGIAGYFDGGTSNGYGVVVLEGKSGFETTTPAATVHASSISDSMAGWFVTSSSTVPNSHGILEADYTGTSNLPTAFMANAYNIPTNTGTTGIEGIGTAVGVYAVGQNTSTVSTSSVRGLNAASYGNESYSLGAGLYAYANGGTPATSYGAVVNASGGTANYGLYAFANVYIAAGLTVTGTKSFKIDDPIDPDNKYLYHSCVESPDMMNIYNGNVTTDASGTAVVTLPDYFEALNQDFRYQLTVIGTFAQAIIGEKVHDNKFTIRTSAPNVEVSWQVTGIRHDAYAAAHPMDVEVDKESFNKGKYLSPKELGKPETAMIGYEVSKSSGIRPTQTTIEEAANRKKETKNTIENSTTGGSEIINK